MVAQEADAGEEVEPAERRRGETAREPGVAEILDLGLHAGIELASKIRKIAPSRPLSVSPASFAVSYASKRVAATSISIDSPGKIARVAVQPGRSGVSIDGVSTNRST